MHQASGPWFVIEKVAVDWIVKSLVMNKIALSHRFSTTAPASQEIGVAERELLIARRTVGGLRWGLILVGGVWLTRIPRAEVSLLRGQSP
jgi:hypothetical protein